MVKETLKYIPNFGYIKLKSNIITSNKSILERAVLFERVTQISTSSRLKTEEKAGKKKSVQKYR